ncbi:MAG: FAD-dependent oxidoreductase [Planifilum fimeticola]
MLGRIGPICANPFRRIVQCKEKGEKHRETRRIDGEYSLKHEDVVAGGRFADGITRSGSRSISTIPREKGVKAPWIGGDGAHDIPCRSLLPKKVDNLLAAGRAFPPPMRRWATGQAAGTRPPSPSGKRSSPGICRGKAAGKTPWRGIL